MIRRQLLRQARGLSTHSSSSQSISQLPSFLRPRHPQPLSSISSQLPPRLQRRWQSTEPNANAETASNSASSSSDSTPKEAQPTDSSPENALQKELDIKTREAIDLKDKYLRSVADFRNLQERTRRDIESARQFAIQRFATDLIESVDNLDRALESVPAEALNPDVRAPSTSDSPSTTSDSNTAAPSESTVSSDPDPPNKDLLNLHAGLKMTESILLQTLKKHGLERFDPLDGGGRKFDPGLDEATFMTKVEGREDGDVFFTQNKGYLLNGRVLRAAKVGVVKNS